MSPSWVKVPEEASSRCICSHHYPLIYGIVSATHHLHSEEPLFTRLMSLGGTSLLMKPLPSFVYEATYKTVMENLGLGSASASERVKALLEISPDELLAKTPPSLPLFPVCDGDLIPVHNSFEDIASQKQTLPGKLWCKSILIGDCQFDVSRCWWMELPSAMRLSILTDQD